MNIDTFNKVVKEQLLTCEKLLTSKGDEYAPGTKALASSDRLVAFKRAAAIQDISQEQALVGMLAKHIVSIYEMAGDDFKKYPMDRWTEKITDSINYLLLLKAVVEEEAESNG